MANNPYTAPTQSGYNATPPADDGSVTEANKIKWDTIKTKLADPNQVYATAISDAVSTAMDSTINTGDDENNSMTGSLAFGSSELTIASGSITPTRSHHTVDTEADASTDDLVTIATASVSDECYLLIRAANTARTIVVKNFASGSDNIYLDNDQDFTIDDDEKSILLRRDGANWIEISRSNIAIAATKTEQEAGTSTTVFVTPENQQDHPSACKAYVNFTITGSINKAFNIGSVDDDGVGDWGANYSTSFSSVNYAAIIGAFVTSTTQHNFKADSQLASSCEILFSGETNLTAVSLACYGEQ